MTSAELSRRICDADKKAIQELRENLPEGLISSYYDTDFNLLRWLQGYDFDVETVLPSLIHHLRVRKAWALVETVDPSLNGSVQLAIKYWPIWLGGPTGKAANNYIFCIEPTGKVNPVDILKCVSALDSARRALHFVETLFSSVMKQEELTGIQSGVLVIMDMDGLKLDQV